MAAGAAGLVVVAEVGARGRLDPVGPVAEVDGVEVLGEDLLLAPAAREVVGQRGLAELLEDRALALGLQRDLDELLRDGRAALGAAVLGQVGHERAGDAADVDAVVGVEALVLHGDDRVLHHRRDLARPRPGRGSGWRRAGRAAGCGRRAGPSSARCGTAGRFSSAGRSDETAIIIPKTVETSARAARPARISTSRSFFSRGRRWRGRRGKGRVVARGGSATLMGTAPTRGASRCSGEAA